MSLTKQQRHDGLLRLTLSEFEFRQQAFGGFYRAQAGFYDLFRGYWEGKSDPQFNNIHVPLAYSTIMSDVAALVQIELGGQTAVQMQPVGPEDFQDARKAEKLLEGQFYAAKMTKKLTRLTLQGNLYGVGVAQYGYRTQYGPISREVGMNSMRGMQAFKQGATNRKYEGPDISIVDPANFFPEPGFQDIPDMNSVLARFYTDNEAIPIKSRRGPNDEPSVYDFGWAKEYLDSSRQSAPLRPDALAFRKSMAAGGLSEANMPKPPGPFDAVELIERWGRVPDEYGLWFNVKDNVYSDTEMPDSRRVTELIVTVVNRTHVLRAVPIPHADQQKPFLAYKPHEDAHHFHPPGKCELIGKLNAAANKLVSSQLDALDFAINPPRIVNRLKVDTRRYKHGPGRTIYTDGPTTEQDIRPYMTDFRGINASMGEVAYLNQLVQQATGRADDVAQGVATSKRQSATEFAGRSDAVATRVGLEAKLLEAEFMEPLAGAWWELNRQFLQTPFLVRQLGGNAIWDPVTERFTSPDLAVITDIDLEGEWNFRATGATRQVGKYARQQSMLQLLPALVPYLPMMNARALLRQMMPIFDFTNVDELMNTSDTVMQALMMWVQQYMQQGQTDRGQPTSAGGMDPASMTRMLKMPGAEVAPTAIRDAVNQEVMV